jgi:UDP-GlcNAc:undecaprenyl-phosphate GlcNAc-1-phosphate transferase
MTTIIFVFFIAFLSSLLLTPIVIRVATRLNIVDVPRERKVHARPIPRLGGLVFFLSFFIAMAALSLNRKMLLEVAAVDPRMPLFLIALTASFLLGLWDDIRRLSSGIKFAGQVLIGVFSYYAGIRIGIVSVPFAGTVDLGYLALPATVFWFVLTINAVNLIDGLDGLAAGIGLFVSMTMLVICLTGGRLQEAIGFAALAGTLIGFLRYNFNPAKIFMGDGGSYFLGYFIAALSILGSIKGPVATAILIPVIALGVPLIDTLFAPVRRFLLGQKMFQPDNNHLHHKLIQMGYSHRRAVLVIYGLTIILGIMSIVMVHARDDTAALVLMVLGMGVIFLGRYCGVQEVLNMARLSRWLKDISYESGFSQERRRFLNHQLEIDKTEDILQFWEEVGKTLEFMEFDLAELAVDNRDALSGGAGVSPGSAASENPETGSASWLQEPVISFNWSRNGVKAEEILGREGLLKIEQPLYGDGSKPKHYGTLLLVKDTRNGNPDHSSLRHIEHLRRAMGNKLDKIFQDRLGVRS